MPPLVRSVLARSIALVAMAVAWATPALAQQGPAIPAPVGMVNDFAHVIPAAQAARIYVGDVALALLATSIPA